MKIIIVSQEYPPYAHGGIGTQAHAKAHGLAALGHKVFVITRGYSEREEFLDGSVRVIRVQDFKNRLVIHTVEVDWLTYSAAVAEEISKLQVRIQPDIIDFPEWGGEGFIHLLNRTEFNYVPAAIQLHSPLLAFSQNLGWPEKDSEFYRLGTMMESTCLKLADAIYSSSSHTANLCSAHYDLNCSKIPKIHTGIDLSFFNLGNLPKTNRPTIIFVGRITEFKGVNLLLESALKLVRKWPDLKIEIAGKEQEGTRGAIEKLLKRAAGAGFPDLLDFQGFLDRKELSRHLSRAHVFALPSLYEGGPGFAYLEAMACGLPVIGCNSGGTPEIIRHGENGFLIPPGDVEALTKALDLLLSDPKLREKMGQNARHYVLENADSRKCLKRLEAFYRVVINGKNYWEV